MDSEAIAKLNKKALAAGVLRRPLEYLQNWYAQIDEKFDTKFAKTCMVLARTEGYHIPALSLLERGEPSVALAGIVQSDLTEGADYKVQPRSSEGPETETFRGPFSAKTGTPESSPPRLADCSLHPDAALHCLMRERHRHASNHFAALGRGLVAYDDYCRQFRARPVERKEPVVVIRDTAPAEPERQTDVQQEIGGLKALIFQMHGNIGALERAVREVKEQHAGLRSDIASLVLIVRDVLEELREPTDRSDGEGGRPTQETPERESKGPGRSDGKSGRVALPSAAPSTTEHLVIAHVPDLNNSYPYQIVRRHIGSIGRPIKLIRRSNPSARLVLDLPSADVPALWRSVREHHGQGLVFCPTNPSWFRLHELTEAVFAEGIRTLASEPVRARQTAETSTNEDDTSVDP
jgi:hypothetical protein